MKNPYNNFMWIVFLFLFVGLLYNQQENTAGIVTSGILTLVFFIWWFVKGRK